MKVTLVPSPIVENGRPKVFMPVGLLYVATQLHNADISTRIIDINAVTSDNTYSDIPEAIIAQNPDIVGFSTMSAYYATTIRLAQRCRELNSRLKIIFGGPQASFLDSDTLRAFPFIDCIVRGECEERIVQIIDTVASNGDLSIIKGLTFRKNDEIIRTPDAPLISDLNTLPDPNYKLYPWVSTVKSIFLESGRGCPYNCVFCSTSKYWQRTSRFWSISRIIALIKKVMEEYGVDEFVFTDDLFSVSRKRVVQFCEALKTNQLNIGWGCNSRIDCLDPPLLHLMTEAGCNRIFLGIESGSKRVQKSIGKNLNLDQVLDTAHEIARLGMNYTASFIIGFPDERLKDLIDTIRFAMKLRYIGGACEDVLLQRLYPLPASRYAHQYRNDLRFDGNFYELTCGTLADEDMEMIRTNKEVFSCYYYFPTRYFDRRLIVGLHAVTANIIHHFLYTGFILFKDSKLKFPEIVVNLPPTEVMHGEYRYGTLDSFVETCHFLDNLVEKTLELNDHPIRDLMKYELTMKKVRKFEKGDYITEDFTFDVEKYILEIKNNRFTKLPDHIDKKHVTMIFTKKDGIIMGAKLPNSAN